MRGRGSIFISYRRQETAANAGRLYDHLSERFGEDRVFMDIDSIAIGTDFTEAIAEAVSECDILLVLIGREWSTITDSAGRRRIDNPDDYVRVEIETALKRNIRTVPVLVDGAPLPRVDDLPASLRPLTRRQALELDYANFRSQITRLIAAVDEVIEPETTADDVMTERPAAAAATSLPGSGMLTLAREPSKWKDRLRAYEVVVDDNVIAKIKGGEQLDLPLAAGRHAIYLKIDWCRSRVVDVDVRPGGTIRLHCKSGSIQGLWRIEGYIDLIKVLDAPADPYATPYATESGTVDSSWPAGDGWSGVSFLARRGAKLRPAAAQANGMTGSRYR